MSRRTRVGHSQRAGHALGQGLILRKKLKFWPYKPHSVQSNNHKEQRRKACRFMLSQDKYVMFIDDEWSP